MPIGTSDGKTYDSELDYHLDQPSFDWFAQDARPDPEEEKVAPAYPEDSVSPADIAAYRTARSVVPEQGRKEGRLTQTIDSVVPTLVEFASKGPKLLQDAAEGRLDLDSPEATGRVLEVASMFGIKAPPMQYASKLTPEWETFNAWKKEYTDLKKLSYGDIQKDYADFDTYWSSLTNAHWKMLDAQHAALKGSPQGLGGYLDAVLMPPAEFIGNKLEKAYAQVKSYFAEKHIRPIDWQKDVKLIDPASLEKYIGPDKAEAARNLGFNLEAPLYKGGKAEYQAQIPDPLKKEGERGWFLADNPKIARAYMNQNVADKNPLPYVARAENAHEVDWLKVNGGDPLYDSTTMHSLIEASRRKGADLLIIKNVEDVGSSSFQNQYVVLDPSILRAPTAKFNPFHVSVRNVFASVAGAGVVPMTILSQRESENKDEK